MSLSSEQHDVAAPRGADSALDGSATIFFDDERRVGLANAGDDLFENRGGPLAAWVVTGDDDEIAAFRSSKAHLRALGPITVAAAAEKSDDAAGLNANTVTSEADE